MTFYFIICFIQQECIKLIKSDSKDISEGSCDTEDRSNYAENSALHHKNKLHF